MRLRGGGYILVANKMRFVSDELNNRGVGNEKIQCMHRRHSGRCSMVRGCRPLRSGNIISRRVDAGTSATTTRGGARARRPRRMYRARGDGGGGGAVLLARRTRRLRSIIINRSCGPAIGRKIIRTGAPEQTTPRPCGGGGHCSRTCLFRYSGPGESLRRRNNVLLTTYHKMLYCTADGYAADLR